MWFKKSWKFVIMLGLLSSILLLVCACGAADAKHTVESTQNNKVSIVTTMFPQYDFARQIAGDKAEVLLLVDPGVEVHSFEPSANDIVKINNADLLIHSGYQLEPWVENVAKNLPSKALAVDITNGLEQNGLDYHLWTDPNNAMVMVDNILAALVKKDPQNKDYYTANAAAYQKELQELDAAFREVADNGKRNLMIFADRFPFYYFAKQYHLEHMAAFDSCAEEAEPSVKQITELINTIKEQKIPVVYYEELTEPKVAKTIAVETGVEVLQFHSCHNVSKDDFEAGITYLDLMKRNVEALRQGLN